MWKNRFQRKGNEDQETVTESTTDEQTGRPKELSPLPGKEDRLALYRLLETIVEQRCRAYEVLTDPRSLGVKSFFLGKNAPAVTSFGIRKRQIDYLRLHALPTMGAALLLGIEDIQGEELLGDLKKAQSVVSNETENSNKTQSTGAKSATVDEEESEPALVLPSLTDPVACITLLISNLVLVSKGNYDARVRNILKTACVPLLEESVPEDGIQDENRARALYFLTEEHTKCDKKEKSPVKKKKSMVTKDIEDKEGVVVEEEEEEEEEEEQVEAEPAVDWERTTRIPKLSRCRVATQQFESIERAIATDILKELVERDQAAMQHATKANTWKDTVVRGLQITTMGVVVGSLFAFTGGLAAPGLVAAITALGVHSTAVFAALTTTTALASMFGAVGGGLGAYKMSKRVRGIKEWRIRKETTTTKKADSKHENDAIQLRGLHSHVCVSGWLAEKCDFQRPFGVKCQDPCMPPLNALQRFFCVHAPEKVKHAETILKESDQVELWAQLKEEYGKTPDELLPLQGQAQIVLSQDSCVGINNLLLDHVLPESAVGKMKELWEVNTMLIQMEAKNNELQTTANFIPDDVFLDEEEEEIMDTLKQEAMKIASEYPEYDDQNSLDVQEKEPKVSCSQKEVGDIDLDERKSDFGVEKVQIDTVEQEGMTRCVFDEGDVILATPSTLSNQHSIVEDPPNSEDPPNGDDRTIGASIVADPPSEGGGESSSDFLGLSTVRARIRAAMRGRGDAKDESDGITPTDRTAVEPDSGINFEEMQKQEIDKEIAAKAEKAGGMDNHLEIIWDWQATYSGELYTLTWETDFLLKLCRVATVLFLEISDTLGKQILTNALVGSVVAIPSALLTASIVIDDPYQLISLRSKQAGIELAHCLLTSDEHRPISLVGFSFGARLIFDCLLEIARHQLIWQRQQAQKENVDDAPDKNNWGFIRRRRSGDQDKIEYVREPASIIEDVVLIGMPRVLDQAEWITCREMVGGRLVNCFNRKDWIVSYMINIRCFGAISKTCGTHEVVMEGVENYEVSDFASTHDRYLAAVPQILNEIGYTQPKPRK